MAIVNAKALYPATFTKKEVISINPDTENVDCVAGQYTEIGEYVVKADELVGIGRGASAAQSDAIGRLYAQFKDADEPNAVITTGKFRIMLMSSQDIPIGSKPVYLDVDLAALLTGADIPSDRFIPPFDNTMLSKDKKFKFLLKLDKNVTVSYSRSTVLLDVTRALL